MGPRFTGGSFSDLSAHSEPFNGDGNCYSSANGLGYRIPLDGALKNMLTNKSSCGFTITELEVW